MKKILRKHGIAALILGGLLAVSYLITDNLHGGLDYIGGAIFWSSITLILAGAFIVNLFLLAADTIIYFSPIRGKIFISRILLLLYGAALLYTVYSAFSFSYGKFFSYLAEGEFFSYLHVIFFAVLIIMILVRMHKLKKLKERLHQ